MTGKDTAALVRRLRDTARRLVSLGNSDAPICNEAADLIEAQAAEIARLKRKLHECGVDLIEDVDAHIAALKEPNQ